MATRTFSGTYKRLLFDPSTDRAQIVLEARGCTYARRLTRGTDGARGPCKNCAFWRLGKPLVDVVYPVQLEKALAVLRSNPVSNLCLYLSGSFLNPQEVSVIEQGAMLGLIAREPWIKSVLIESRPEFVEPNQLRELKQILGEKSLSVAIGLETADDQIRSRCINKGFTLADFESAVSGIANAGAILTSYSLLKPLGLSEGEAIEDMVKTLNYLARLSITFGLDIIAAIEPCFVQKGSELYRPFKKGNYLPPWLWSIVEVLNRVSSIDFGRMKIRVAFPEEEPMPIAIRENRASSGERCGCSNQVEAAIYSYNLANDARVFSNLDCSCREIWRSTIGL